MTEFVDEHREAYGVESICHALAFAPSTYYAVKQRQRCPSARCLSDADVLAAIRRVHERSRGLYGARKVWLQLRRDGIPVARCTVERLMRKHGLEGVRRGRRRRTTVPDDQAGRPLDLVDRNFGADGPNELWVADFTYVMTWSGVVYVAFVIDAFSRRIVGWKADTSMKTALVLDTLEMALWSRQRDGIPLAQSLIHHHDAGSQYTSFAFTSRLIEAGVDASVGSVGDGYDNALAETTIGLYKTEKIHREGPWRTLSDVELATLEWVDWYNHERLHSGSGDAPPVEYENNHLKKVLNRQETQ
jgi:putative transposase